MTGNLNNIQLNNKSEKLAILQHCARTFNGKSFYEGTVRLAALNNRISLATDTFRNGIPFLDLVESLFRRKQLFHSQ